MLKLSFSSVITSAFLSLTFLGATPALALSALTFVSGKGVDSGTCALASTPCRIFQFAFAQTRAGGEIKTLDPASYGGLIIEPRSVHRPAVSDWTSFRPRLATTPLPFSLPSALRKPGSRTCTD